LKKKKKTGPVGNKMEAGSNFMQISVLKKSCTKSNSNYQRRQFRSYYYNLYGVLKEACKIPKQWI
jgi:hypothetical protein